MNTLRFGLIVCAIFGFLGGSVGAQSGIEQIQDFRLNANVNAQGSALITETIIYDFGSNERRGIFRNIPINYYVDGEMGYKLDIDVLSVTRGGSDEQFVLETTDRDFLTLRIGDSNVYVSGEHSYEIVYATSPLAISADDGLEIIRLDVPGTGWEVPVLNASIAITGAGDPEEACYKGVLGATLRVCDVSDNSVSASSTVNPGETLTGEFAYPAGTFTKTAELVSLEESLFVPALIGGAAGSVAGFFGLQQIIGRLRHRSRKKDEIAYPRYEPPTELGPAELGLLVDNSSSGAELTATILELAVAGYIKIVQDSDKKLFKKAVYSFHATDKKADMGGYQQDIYAALLGDKTTATTKEIAKSTTFQAAHQKFHKTLRTNLESLGFYKPVNVFRPNLANRMSDEGYAKWAEVEGFREFLSLTEKNRIDMLEAPERKPETFSQFLPYAVALGVEEAWAKQFESLDVRIDDWYDGPSNANGVILASQISGISSGLGSMSASAAQSSGSSGSGGGFSGGGFSGGGGGSW